MKRVIMAIGLLAVPMMLCTVQLDAAPPFLSLGAKKADIKWETDLFAAHKRSLKENKPMLLVFGAEWCGFCKKLESQTLGHPELAKYINETFIPVHLDADKEEKVTKILDVGSLPCSIVLSPKADLLGRIDGYFQPGPYYQKLAAARQALDAAEPVSQVNAP